MAKRKASRAMLTRFTRVTDPKLRENIQKRQSPVIDRATGKEVGTNDNSDGATSDSGDDGNWY